MGVRDRFDAVMGLVVGLGATAAVLSPLVGMEGDSFPISSYPMFAHPRGQPTLFAVIARAADGREVRLPPSMVGSAEVLQTKVLIQRSVQQGEGAMRALCEGVAARVGAVPGDLRTIEIVRRRYDPVSYFTSGPQPIEQARLLSCRVPGARKARRRGAR